MLSIGGGTSWRRHHGLHRGRKFLKFDFSSPSKMPFQSTGTCVTTTCTEFKILSLNFKILKVFILYLNIGNWNHIGVRIRYFATIVRNKYLKSQVRCGKMGIRMGKRHMEIITTVLQE